MYSALLLIGKTQHPQLVTALALAALTACHARPKPLPAPLTTLRGTGIHIETTRGESGALDLWFRTRPGAPAIARLRGVYLTLEHGAPRLLPFVKSKQQGKTLELSCAAAPGTPEDTQALLENHAIRILIHETSEGRAEVEVRDQITLRSGIRALTVNYEFLPEGTPDEIVAPFTSPDPDGLIGDIAFTSPVTLLRKGNTGLAILPDLGALLESRRLPQALTVAASPRPTIRHGLTQYLVKSQPEGTAFTSTGTQPTLVRSETVSFRHSLRLFDKAQAHITATQLHADAWERYASPRFARSAQPLGDRTNNSLIDGALTATIPSNPTQLPFETSSQAIRTATGLAMAALDGLHKGQVEAEQLVLDLLAIPHRGVIFPAAQPAPGSSTTPVAATDANAAFASMTGFWLLQVVPYLNATQQGVVRRRCDDLARFLRANQSEKGIIPTRYNRSYWQPQPGPETESTFVAFFLAEHGIQRDNSESLDAAARLLVHLQSIQTPSLDGGNRNSKTRELLPLICTANTAIRLAEARNDLDSRKLATHLLESLFSSQQVWSPNWLETETQFGFRADNQHISGNDPTGAVAGAALVDGYRLTGRRDFLQRGIQALRSALTNSNETWTPKGQVSETAHWGRSTAATHLQRIQAQIGQGVVDVAGGFAEGVDALWFEDLVIDSAQITFRLLTHADFDQSTTIRFRNLPSDAESYHLVINEQVLGSFGREALENGVELTPQKVGRLRFQPPPFIRADHEWVPRAIVELPTDPSAKVYLELRKPKGTVHSVELRPRAAEVPNCHQEIPSSSILEPSLSHQNNSPIRGPREGEHFDCRLVWQVGDRTVHVPTTGYYRIESRATNCVDFGDADELELTNAGNSRIVRFSNGQEAARVLTRVHADDEQAALSCCLPIPHDSTAVTMRIHATGDLLVRAGPQLHEIHRSTGATGIHTTVLDLTDSRLWREGHLDIRLSPAEIGKDKTVQVARIDYASSGQAIRSTPMSAAVEALDAPPRIRALIIPITLTGTQPRSDRTTLEQLFFGDEDYHRTPPPEPRLTEGSVATLIKEESGGLTEFTGEVSPRIHIDLLPAQVRDDPVNKALELVGATLSKIANVDLESFDVVVAVYSGPTLPAPFDGHSLPARFGRRIVFLPETASDGSYLPSGTALLAVLRETFGLVDYASPEHGNFGELALSAIKGGHTPPAFLGMNRLRLGWAEKITLNEEVDGAGPTRFFLPVADHSIYELPFHDLPGRGQLLLEVRKARPRTLTSPSTGALAYWKFAPGHAPITVAPDGSEHRTIIRRLSTQHSSLESPFQSGTREDLITEAARLSDTSSPSIATPEGEILWAIHDLQNSSEGVSLRLSRESLDLLGEGPSWWTGRNDKHHLLPQDGVDRGLGYVRRGTDKLTIGTGSAQNWQLRGKYQLPASPLPQRLFLCFEHKHDSTTPWISVRLDGQERVFGPLQPRQSGEETATDWFQVDFPRLPQGGELEVVLTNRSGASQPVDLTRALLVPRTQRPQAILIEGKPITARLGDGVTYGGITELSTGETGRSNWRVPIVLPKGKATLLLKAGLPSDYDGEPIRVRASVRTPDGKWEAQILDVQLGRTQSNATGTALFQAMIPNIPSNFVAFFDLSVEGVKDQSVFLVSLAIDRP